jgi:hypothetical protein
MNTKIEKLKIIENKKLNVLVFDPHNNINIQNLISLYKCGNIFVAVESTITSANLISHLNGIKNIKVILTRRIPIIDYDVIIFPYYSDYIQKILSLINVKYVYIFDKPGEFALKFNFYEIEKNLFKKSLTKNEKIETQKFEAEKLEKDPFKLTDEEKKLIENVSSNYNINFENISSIEINYDKYLINYLKPVIPGKVSIIMIVSECNNKFADTLRAIRHQKLPSIEYIIIDNAAGFRNNVKANIKYSDKMPYDFCVYHAKELCEGEFMFVFNENSDEVDILKEINKGQYETR